ncbi:Crp/Fnr family transcriptional regulator [Sphingorhabdus lutea]|uniref:Crp/Fnr family transcriptional regulator n=1 Tax=Sphingorhabdus lutea TaxID=1913578 RepID=A0A1L3J9X1_9SPHN|nr:Crp/Fnr family transcriptional regulator [Sphingorhabdus lutea]APG61921.1 Crp/Fnr family transcriptional regulator [Sphingorhabdus lutea]
MMDCSECVVRNRAICAGLNPDELAILSNMGHKKTLKAGDILLWEGEASVIVANILNGVLKLSTNNENGDEQIVGILFESEFVGRPFGTKNPFTITAVTDTKLCVFGRSDFEQFSASHPDLQQKLLEQSLNGLDQTRHWLAMLGHKSASAKIATFLLVLSERLAANNCKSEAFLDDFILPFDRQQIANILGLTIETTSRQLSRMRNDGVIDLPTRRKVVINDRYAMEALAG